MSEKAFQRIYTKLSAITKATVTLEAQGGPRMTTHLPHCWTWLRLMSFLWVTPPPM